MPACYHNKDINEKQLPHKPSNTTHLSEPHTLNSILIIDTVSLQQIGLFLYFWLGEEIHNRPHCVSLAFSITIQCNGLREQNTSVHLAVVFLFSILDRAVKCVHMLYCRSPPSCVLY